MAKRLVTTFVTLFLALCFRKSPVPFSEQKITIVNYLYKYQKLTVSHIMTMDVLNNQVFTFFFLQF